MEKNATAPVARLSSEASVAAHERPPTLALPYGLPEGVLHELLQTLLEEVVFVLLHGLVLVFREGLGPVAHSERQGVQAGRPWSAISSTGFAQVFAKYGDVLRRAATCCA